ncbi:hypothetical protein BK738_29840 [Bacillus thuringiensis serovar rongseni]|nr:hypothetical protein BK738_29840 [Bacillus thuringiensis serovar rongseni]
MPSLRSRLNNIQFIKEFMSCVFRHFSQYKYIMVIPKQPAHLLPKSGHDSATLYGSNDFNIKVALSNWNNF